MLQSNSINVLVVMQVGARRKCRHAGNIVQNNADNANGDAYTTNQTSPFVRIKYLKKFLTIIFCYQL